MTGVPPNDGAARAQIAALLERSVAEYPDTREERRAVDAWEEDREFSVLGIIELYTADVSGYGHQVVERGALTDPGRGVPHLRRMRFLRHPEFAEWYLAQGGSHPRLRAYVEMIDYLRLLILDHAAGT